MPFLHAAQHLPPVDLRHHHIEQDQVGRDFLQHPEPFFRAAYLANPVTLHLEVHAHVFPHARVVVDDDEKVRELVRVNLEFEGYVVREAGSAEAGMQAIEEAKPDLVLLDVMMPHVDGWEMLRRVQERYGAGAIPVVMFSGKVDEQAQLQANSAGAQGFIGKPFDLQQLIDQAKQIAPV